MNWEKTYLAERPRRQLAIDYILHEAKKLNSEIFVDAGNKIEKATSIEHRAAFEAFSKCNREEVITFVSELSTEDLWRLFHALSYGVIEKELYNCVCEPSFSWEKEELLPSRLVFETKLECLRELQEEHPSLTSALGFVRNLDQSRINNCIDKYQKHSKDDRSKDVLIGRRQSDNQVLIHDGNGRLLLFCCLIALNMRSDKEAIDVWVGRDQHLSVINNRMLYDAARMMLFKVAPV